MGERRNEKTLTFAGLAMCDRLGGVAIVAILAVVAIASGGVVAAVDADAAALVAAEFVQLHVEAAAASVEVAVAG